MEEKVADAGAEVKEETAEVALEAQLQHAVLSMNVVDAANDLCKDVSLECSENGLQFEKGENGSTQLYLAPEGSANATEEGSTFSAEDDTEGGDAMVRPCESEKPEESAWFQNKIRGVYERRNPSKLSDLEGLFEKYKGCEMALYQRVCAKYGEDPNYHNFAATVETTAKELQDPDDPDDLDDQLPIGQFGFDNWQF